MNAQLDISNLLAAADATTTTIDLCNNSIGDNGASVIAEKLDDLSLWEELDLRKNNIGASGVAAIAKKLETNPNSTIRVLLLGQNNIGDDGAKDIACMLKRNTKLRVLGLSKNNISNVGANAIAEALAHNTALLVLDLGGNKVTEKCLKMLQHLIDTRKERSKKVAIQESLISLEQITGASVEKKETQANNIDIDTPKSDSSAPETHAHKMGWMKKVRRMSKLGRIKVAIGGYDVYLSRVPIAEGSFGSVYRAKSFIDGQKYALKRILTRNRDDLSRIEEEIQIMSLCENDHIVKLLASDTRQENKDLFVIDMLMEYCDGGTVVDVLISASKNGSFLSPPSVMNIFVQVCDAVAHIHTHTHATSSSAIIHGDIKAENILYRKMDRKWKLCDFGSAFYVDNLNRLSRADLLETIEKFTTPAYRAPELISVQVNSEKTPNITITEKVDVWALGILLFKLMTVESPFPDDSPLAIFNFKPTNLHWPQGCADVYPQAMRDLVVTCLDVNPNTRIDSTKLLHLAQNLCTQFRPSGTSELKLESKDEPQSVESESEELPKLIPPLRRNSFSHAPKRPSNGDGDDLDSQPRPRPNSAPPDTRTPWSHTSLTLVDAMPMVAVVKLPATIEVERLPVDADFSKSNALKPEGFSDSFKGDEWGELRSVTTGPPLPPRTGELFRMISTGDTRGLQRMVKEMEIPLKQFRYFVNNEGRTLLMAACVLNRADMVEMMIKHGVSPNEGPLCQVRHANDNDIWGSTPLIDTIQNGVKSKKKVDVLNTLIKHGADVNLYHKYSGASPMRAASIQDDVGVFRLILEGGGRLDCRDEKGWTPLMACVKEGHESICSELLSSPKGAATIDLKAWDSGYTALIIAVMSGRAEMARILIHKGADVRNSGYNGDTAMSFALRGQQHVIIDELLRCGADPFTFTFTSLPNEIDSDACNDLVVYRLLWTASHRTMDAVISLISKSSESDMYPSLAGDNGPIDSVTTTEGFSALMLAIRNQDEQATRVLLDCGASVEITANDGETTPLSLSVNAPDSIQRLIKERRTINMADENSGESSSSSTPSTPSTQSGMKRFLRAMTRSDVYERNRSEKAAAGHMPAVNPEIATSAARQHIALLHQKLPVLELDSISGVRTHELDRVGNITETLLASLNTISSAVDVTTLQQHLEGIQEMLRRPPKFCAATFPDTGSQSAESESELSLPPISQFAEIVRNGLCVPLDEVITLHARMSQWQASTEEIIRQMRERREARAKAVYAEESQAARSMEVSVYSEFLHLLVQSNAYAGVLKKNESTNIVHIQKTIDELKRIHDHQESIHRTWTNFGTGARHVKGEWLSTFDNENESIVDQVRKNNGMVAVLDREISDLEARLTEARSKRATLLAMNEQRRSQLISADDTRSIVCGHITDVERDAADVSGDIAWFGEAVNVMTRVSEAIIPIVSGKNDSVIRSFIDSRNSLAKSEAEEVLRSVTLLLNDKLELQGILSDELDLLDKKQKQVDKLGSVAAKKSLGERKEEIMVEYRDVRSSIEKMSSIHTGLEVWLRLYEKE